MAINASEKFRNAINNELYENYCTYRTIDNIKEIDEIYNKRVGNHLRAADRDYKYIRGNSKITNIRANEWTYANGFRLLILEIEYDENGKSHKSSQTIVTNDSQNIPLIFLTTDYRKRAPQQLFSKSSPGDDIFPEHMRNIEVQDVNICIDGVSIGYFQTLANSEDGVMLERYIQNYSVTSADEKSDFLKLCGSSAKCLEIIYSESKPIYAQFAGNHKVESAEYDPNSMEDAKKIEDEINKEVDAIVSRISSVITSQNKKSTEYVRK